MMRTVAEERLSSRQESQSTYQSIRKESQSVKTSLNEIRSNIQAISMAPTKLNGPTLVSVDFEVYGDVQGVFFPKYCREMCVAFQLRGWVRNTRMGTIIGKIQGEKDKVDEMAMWLRLQGSPGSRIERCEFRKWGIIDSYDFRDFRIVY